MRIASRARWAVLAAAAVLFTVACEPVTFTAAFAKTADLESGYEATYTLTNTSATPVNLWTVRFDLPAGTTVASSSNADVTTNGIHITATSTAASAPVVNGSPVTFGFTTVGTGLPTNCTLNGRPCTRGTTTTTTTNPTTTNPTTTTTMPGGGGPATCPWYELPRDGGAPTVFVWRDGTSTTSDAPIFSPTLAKLLKVDSSGLVLADFDGSNPVTVVAPPTPLSSVSAGPFAPDGHHALGATIKRAAITQILLDVIDVDTATVTSIPDATTFNTTDLGQPDAIDPWSPDAHHAVVVSEDGAGAHISVLDISGATPTITPLMALTGFQAVLGWSSDSSWIAFASTPAGSGPLRIDLVRADGQQIISGPSIDVSIGMPTPWAWRPGTNTFAVLSGADVTMIDADTETTSTITLPGVSPFRGPSFSPDGAWVAWSDATQVHRMQVGGGSHTAVTPFAASADTVLGAPAWSPDGLLLGVSQRRGVPTAAPGPVLDVAITDDDSVVRTALGVAGPYNAGGFAEIIAWPGTWSPDGTGFRASANGFAPTVNGRFPISVIVPTDGSAVTKVERRVWWQTCLPT